MKHRHVFGIDLLLFAFNSHNFITIQLNIVDNNYESATIVRSKSEKLLVMFDKQFALQQQQHKPKRPVSDENKTTTQIIITSPSFNVRHSCFPRQLIISAHAFVVSETQK